MPASPWRWMILLSRFLYTFLALGSLKSLGVFLPHFVHSLDTTMAVAGLVASLFYGAGQTFVSPFIGALMNVWDPRRLSIAGGLVAASSFVAASFSSHIYQMGVLLAISGCGLVLQNSVLKLLMDYFPDDFASVNGIGLLGGSVGMMVLPPVMEWLVSVYGWRNAFGLLGALQFNYVMSSALLRPLRSAAKYEPVRSHSDFDRESDLSATEGSDRVSRPRDGRVSKFREFLSSVGEQMDADVLAEPVFLVHQLIFLLVGCVYSAWHVFLIPHCLALGYGEAPSAYLATFGGLGSLVGRLGHGFLVDRGLLSASGLFVLSCLVFAASSLLDPLAVSSYAALAALASLSGLAIGAIFPLVFVLMREVTGDSHMAAYFWVYVPIGTGITLGALFAGWIGDSTGSIEPVFPIMGVTSLAVATMVASTRCILRCCDTSVDTK